MVASSIGNENGVYCGDVDALGDGPFEMRADKNRMAIVKPHQDKGHSESECCIATANVNIWWLKQHQEASDNDLRHKATVNLVIILTPTGRRQHMPL